MRKVECVMKIIPTNREEQNWGKDDNNGNYFENLGKRN